MAENNQKFIDRCIKDKNGKVVLGQSPNAPILIFIILTVIAFIIPEGEAKGVISQIATFFAFVWAYLEISSGINYFRRTLGMIVLCWIILNFTSVL